MKKLMLTTAIASVLATSAMAQTTITGELRINYKDGSMSKGIANASAGTPDTIYGFGAEQQINFATKGKLNVGGLDYASGFSIENDGEQTGTLFNENVYIDLTNASSGTTISFGRDHIQRSDSDFSATNLVGFTPNELSQLNDKANTHFQQNIGASPSKNYGAAIVQKTPFGSLSYNWVPNNGTNKLATIINSNSAQPSVILLPDALASVGASEDVNPNTTAAYEYGFVGDLGVKGLQVHYFKNANQKSAVVTNTIEAEGKNYGIKYNFGQFTVGANKKVNQAETATVAATEITENAYSAAYAVNNNLSIGVLYAKAEANTVAGEQKLKAINIGYALGPVDLAIGYAKNTDVEQTSGSDTDVFMARLIGKF
jgi:hypothetical protein